MMAFSRSVGKRILAVAIAFIMLLGSAFVVNVAPVNAESTKIGHATNDEKGGLRGGKAGDQTGSEVATGSWRYGGGAFHWTFVARPKSVEIAAKMANQMQAACDNNHIGYDQSNRISIYTAAKASGWDMSKISSYVECDCISLVCTVATAAGAPVSPYAGSSTLKSYLAQSGYFDIYTTSDYTASTDKLLPGDILCAEGRHACMVIESPNPLCFDVNYKNTSGKKKVAKVEMNETITLNYNNGKPVKTVVVDKNMNLKNYSPSKSGYTVKGWQKVGRNDFSVSYESSMASIATGHKAKKISKKK